MANEYYAYKMSGGNGDSRGSGGAEAGKDLQFGYNMFIIFLFALIGHSCT